LGQGRGVVVTPVESLWIPEFRGRKNSDLIQPIWGGETAALHEEEFGGDSRGRRGLLQKR